MSVTTTTEPPAVSASNAAAYALPKSDIVDLIGSADAAMPLDYQKLLDGCSGSVDLLLTLLEEFQINGPRRLESIARRIQRGDSDAATEAAHGLKASADVLAANRLRDIASALERSRGCVGRECQENLVAKLRQEMNRCLEQIPLIIATARADMWAS